MMQTKVPGRYGFYPSCCSPLREIKVLLTLPYVINVRFWHEADRQSPHASISPPYSTPQQRWSETTPGVAVGVNPQSGSHNHRHNANAWPHQRNPLFYLRRFLTELTEMPS